MQRASLCCQDDVIPQSTARLRIFWVVDVGRQGGASYLDSRHALCARHALQPMGEPCHDIMVIFREAAAADKVCLHVTPLSQYTSRR